MFARIALRVARMPLIRSPFARPESLIDLSIPAFHVGAAHGRVRALARRRRAAEESLLDTAVAALPKLVSAAARSLAQRRSRLVTSDSTLALG